MVTQVLSDWSATVALDDTRAVTDVASVRRARTEQLPPHVVGTLANIFAALGESTRLRIVQALSGGELCVGDLAAVLDIAVPAVSQHLRVLRALRVVRNRRAGKLVYYSLDDAHVADLFAMALAHVQGEDR